MYQGAPGNSKAVKYFKHRTGEHYAKSNKPDGERQIPYDLTYKWNLINKTKQAKQNQRHGNKEQTDSDQKWGGRSIVGGRKERLRQGTCMKYPWTKTMGGIESGGWECGAGETNGGK